MYRSFPFRLSHAKIMSIADSLPVKMLIYLFITGCLTALVCAQRMIVTHSPSYITFQDQEQPLHTSDVSKVISNTLGVPSLSDLQWKGMLHGSVFRRPKANVLITVITIDDSSGFAIKNKAEFPVIQDSAGVDVDGLMASLQGNFPDKTPLMLDASLDNRIFDVKSEFEMFRKLPNTLHRMSNRLLDPDSVLQEFNIGTLNTSQPLHLSLLGELQMMQDIFKTVQANDNYIKTNMPDLYSFTIAGLHHVAEKHGKMSAQSKDASVLVADFLTYMTKQFMKLYKDNVVVEILLVSPPSSNVRKVRSLKAMQTIEITSSTGYNLARDVDQDYPAIFNICLWFMILMAIAYWGVGYAIWNMDPGRDSIIYRMTTTRLKKD